MKDDASTIMSRLFPMRALGRAPWLVLAASLSVLAAAAIVHIAPAVAAERGSYSKIKLPNPPQWRSGSISRGDNGELQVDTSAKSLNVDPKRFAFLKDYRPGVGSGCAALKKRPNLDARAPASVTSIVHKLAPRYGLDPRLVLAVIAVESNFQHRAVSPKNAQGLMQLIPATAERFGVGDPFNPAENIRGGMQYLRWLLRTFNGDLSLALAGYNAGERAVLKHRGVPPYSETQQYVKKVHALYGCSGGKTGKSRATAALPALGQGGSGSGWPPVREPYDLWSAAASSIERTDNGRCRFRLGRNSDRRSSSGSDLLICR